MKTNSKNPLIAICAFKALTIIGKPSTIKEIYDQIYKFKMYKFNTPSAQKDIGVLGQAIKRHMFDSKRSDKNYCILFHSRDGLRNKNSKVEIIKSAPVYIIKMGQKLEKELK